MLTNLKNILIFSLLCLLTSTALADEELNYLDTKKYSFGIFGSSSLNIHYVDIERINNLPNCCPKFDWGTGVGFNLGFIYLQPITNKLETYIGLYYNDYNGDLISNETIPISQVSGNGFQNAEIEHVINVDLIYTSINIGISFNIFNKTFIKSGPLISYLVSNSFSQEERLIKPRNSGVFTETGTRKRNQYSGEIDDMRNLLFSWNFSIYHIFSGNARNTVSIVPEIGFNLGFNSVHDKSLWIVNSAYLGVSILFNNLSRQTSSPIMP